MEMLSVGALAASSSSRMLRFDSLARKLKLASARPLGAPYVGPGLRQPSRASRERERESNVRSSVVIVLPPPPAHITSATYLLSARLRSRRLAQPRAAPWRGITATCGRTF